jgi:hypothetical protein
VFSAAALEPLLQADRAVVAAKGFMVGSDAVAPPLGNDLLIAIGGTCGGSADGKCQQVFFFIGTRYLGTDTLKPSTAIGSISPAGPGRIRVSYANYRPNDPLCCPGLPPVPITYTWDGGALHPDGTPPGH